MDERFDEDRALVGEAGAESGRDDQRLNRSRSESEETMTYSRPPGFRRSRDWSNNAAMSR
jgi:hypothetical protein